jgi:hypothetical protein
MKITATINEEICEEFVNGRVEFTLRDISPNPEREDYYIARARVLSCEPASMKESLQSWIDHLPDLERFWDDVQG